MLSSWHTHCDSLPGSFGKCRTVPSGTFAASVCVLCYAVLRARWADIIDVVVVIDRSIDWLIDWLIDSNLISYTPFTCQFFADVKCFSGWLSAAGNVLLLTACRYDRYDGDIDMLRKVWVDEYVNYCHAFDKYDREYNKWMCIRVTIQRCLFVKTLSVYCCLLYTSPSPRD